MSRNRGRTGGPRKRGSNPTPPAVMNKQEESGGEALAFVIPTEFVELPSTGKFYPEGHPLHNEESIEIRHMTAKEEDILTSRTLLKQGVALERVIKNIIVNKTINPFSLLVGDRNAILVAARISAYGSEYETKVNCPSCGTTQQYSFDLNEAEVYTGEGLEEEDIISNNDGTFTVELPRTKLKVGFKLLTGKEEKSMVNNAETKRKRKSLENNVTGLLEQMIVSVNGDEGARTKHYFIENIPSMDSRALRKAYLAACPDIDLAQYFECEECAHAADMEVPLTADFFWPDR